MLAKLSQAPAASASLTPPFRASKELAEGESPQCVIDLRSANSSPADCQHSAVATQAALLAPIKPKAIGSPSANQKILHAISLDSRIRRLGRFPAIEPSVLGWLNSSDRGQAKLNRIERLVESAEWCLVQFQDQQVATPVHKRGLEIVLETLMRELTNDTLVVSPVLSWTTTIAMGTSNASTVVVEASEAVTQHYRGEQLSPEDGAFCDRSGERRHPLLFDAYQDFRLSDSTVAWLVPCGNNTFGVPQRWAQVILSEAAGNRPVLNACGGLKEFIPTLCIPRTLVAPTESSSYFTPLYFQNIARTTVWVTVEDEAVRWLQEKNLALDIETGALYQKETNKYETHLGVAAQDSPDPAKAPPWLLRCASSGAYAMPRGEIEICFDAESNHLYVEPYTLLAWSQLPNCRQKETPARLTANVSDTPDSLLHHEQFCAGVEAWSFEVKQAFPHFGGVLHHADMSTANGSILSDETMERALLEMGRELDKTLVDLRNGCADRAEDVALHLKDLGCNVYKIIICANLVPPKIVGRKIAWGWHIAALTWVVDSENKRVEPRVIDLALSRKLLRISEWIELAGPKYHFDLELHDPGQLNAASVYGYT